MNLDDKSVAGLIRRLDNNWLAPWHQLLTQLTLCPVYCVSLYILQLLLKWENQQWMQYIRLHGSFNWTGVKSTDQWDSNFQFQRQEFVDHHASTSAQSSPVFPSLQMNPLFEQRKRGPAKYLLWRQIVHLYNHLHSHSTKKALKSLNEIVIWLLRWPSPNGACSWSIVLGHLILNVLFWFGAYYFVLVKCSDLVLVLRDGQWKTHSYSQTLCPGLYR